MSPDHLTSETSCRVFSVAREARKLKAPGWVDFADMRIQRLVAILCLSLALPCFGSAARIEVQLESPGRAVSPTLWGIFFEDINLSADGGIYPELVRNRSFEDAEKPEYWKLSNNSLAAENMS